METVIVTVIGHCMFVEISFGADVFKSIFREAR